MAKKYLKNEKGIVRAITSDNLQLEKPLLNENYDIEVHNRNMDKIDNAIQDVKGKIDGLELVASNVKMADGTTVEDAVSANKISILNNTTLANQALTKANEAFLRGDNVKTQLVDKLISEGLNVSTDNTFEELIGNIALGKKWASGESTSNSATYGFNSIDKTGYYNLKYFDISNLGFVPSTIIYISKSSNSGYGFLTNLSQYFTNCPAYIYYASTQTSSVVSLYTYGIRADEKVFIDNSTVRLPSNGQGVKYSWIAFE